MKNYPIKHTCLSRVVSMVFNVLILTTVSISAFAGTQQKSIVREPLILEKCMQCHGLERITQYRLTERRWGVIVDRMSIKKEAMISKEESKQITEFFAKHYQVKIKELFKKRCIDCHQYINSEELLHEKKTGSGWSRAIERMRKKYSFLIGKEEAELITRFWSNPKNNSNIVKANAQTRRLAIFENKCMRCHTHAFLFGMKKTKEDWMTLLKQKHEKYKHWISIKDKKMIEDYLINDK